MSFDNKKLQCIFCGAVSSTQIELSKNKSSKVLYRSVTCPNCGNYVRPDSPWVFNMGYNNIEKIRRYLSDNKVTDPCWLYLGEPCFFDELCKRNNNIRFVSVEEISKDA